MACTCQTKIGSMKKKHKVSGMNTEDLLMDGLHTLLPGAGMIAAFELKDAVIDKFYKDGATEDEKQTVNMWVNLGGIGLSLLGVAITPKEYKPIVTGVASGFAAECIFALYLSKVKGVTAPTIAGWDNQSYMLAKARMRVAGPDNSSPGLANSRKNIDDIGATLPSPHLRAVSNGV